MAVPGHESTAMLLTPRAGGQGSAIAVVRIRGLRVAGFLQRFFSKSPAAGRCVHGNLHDGKSQIDDCLIVVGDDGNWADICLHGGAWVIESVLLLAEREGFEVLDAKLPVAAEALDEAGGEMEREMLMYLPLARNEAAIRMLLDQPNAWRAALKSGVEGFASTVDAAAVLKDRTLWRLLHPAQIAIVGEPNVGKSTLANRLFGQQRSITADVPGTTRDWVGEMADVAGMPAVLIDTPGLRQTDDAIERAAISASGEKISESELVIEVLDATCASRPLTFPQFPQAGIMVINKIDLPAGWDFQSVDAIRISAKTGQGIDELCMAIHQRMGIRRLDESRPRWWTERQRDILREATANPAALEKLHEKPEIRNPPSGLFRLNGRKCDPFV
ncbi:MAG: GTPase [Tepidisphaeraceae bacterium]